jgi:hypothetical protein
LQGVPPTTTKNSKETETASFHRPETISFKCESFLGLSSVETPEEKFYVTKINQDQEEACMD